MVSLVPVNNSNRSFLDGTSYAAMDQKAIDAMIRDSEAGEHEGSFFRVYSVIADGIPVGIITMYSPSAKTISFGIEIKENYRRKGYAYKAYIKAMSLAEEMGFETVIDAVRTDNTASTGLHEKLGFSVSDTRLSSSGHPVNDYVFDLGKNRYDL